MRGSTVRAGVAARSGCRRGGLDRIGPSARASRQARSWHWGHPDRAAASDCYPPFLNDFQSLVTPLLALFIVGSGWLLCFLRRLDICGGRAHWATSPGFTAQFVPKAPSCFGSGAATATTEAESLQRQCLAGPPSASSRWTPSRPARMADLAGSTNLSALGTGPTLHQY
ncbi:hypothetical protein BD309DRAFT_240964 [Dichomitus squalens]|nr:hypothetical protein BD309DRAFT_240964 [Dichomitus squalens]